MVIKPHYSMVGGSLLKNENLKGMYYYSEKFQFQNKKSSFKMGSVLDTVQSPGQIMKMIFATGQETKKALESKSCIPQTSPEIKYSMGYISRATERPFKMNNTQGIICEVPSLYAHTHLSH